MHYYFMALKTFFILILVEFPCNLIEEELGELEEKGRNPYFSGLSFAILYWR